MKYFIIKSLIIALVPLFLFSCEDVSNGSSNSENVSVDVEFMEAVQKYLPEGYVLSDVAPAPGYHSGKEAFINVAKKLISGGFLDLESGGESRTWLLDCTIEEPVLIYNFRGDPEGCDLLWYFYGEHPLYGHIGRVLYKYNENSDIKWGASEISTFQIDKNAEFIYEGLSKEQAKQILSQKLGKTVQNDPVAVLPNTDYTIGESFLWYFEVSDGGSRSLAHEEYFVGDFVRERASSYNSRSISSDSYVKVQKIKNNQNLLEKIEERKKTQEGRFIGSPGLEMDMLTDDDFEDL